MTWQPIETAPKDGRVVLATGHNQEDGYLSVESMKWWGQSWGWLEGDEPRTPPTHWMPLPEPPTPAQGDE